MTDEEFNKYCAEVMGYKREVAPRMYESQLWVSDGGSSRWHYLPSFNLNQMAEVFDKLIQRIYRNNKESMAFYTQMSSVAIEGKGIAEAMREFIESTAP